MINTSDEVVPAVEDMKLVNGRAICSVSGDRFTGLARQGSIHRCCCTGGGEVQKPLLIQRQARNKDPRVLNGRSFMGQCLNMAAVLADNNPCSSKK